MPDALLTAEPRPETGSRPAGRYRRRGLVPAVVYGLGSDTIAVAVNARELQHILTGGSGANTLITLRIDGVEQLALARQIQRHPVKPIVMHVDFVRVRADQTITADVPLHLEGEAEGVKLGGLLEQMMFAVTIEALPGDIPQSIAHDISALVLGDQLHVRDLSAPPKVVIVNDGDELIAQVSAPRGLEPGEGEAAEGEGAEGAAAEGEAAEGAGSGE